MTKKKSFVMYDEWIDMMDALPDKESLELMRAIKAYNSGKEVTITNPVLKAYFEICVKPKMDANNELYDNKVKNATESAEKRKANNRKRLQANESEAKQDESETVNVNVSVNDNVNDSDNESLRETKRESGKRSPRPRADKAEKNLDLLTTLSGGYPDFSPALLDKLSEWMKYKGKAKSFCYEETGLNNLLKQVEKYTKQYGEGAVIEQITDAMGNGWQGIQWERLARAKPKEQNAYAEFLNW